MATTLLVGDVILAKVVCKDATGGEVFNGYHYGVSSIVGAPTLEDFAANFEAAVFANYQASMSTSCSFDGVEASIINRAMYPTPATSNVHSGAGTIADDPMPGQVSGIISWVTAFSGPLFRGRSYLGNLAVTAINAIGTPTNGALGLFAAIALNAFQFALSSSGGNSAFLTYILWHRKIAGFNIILGLNLPPKFATQKRRGNYGKNRTPPI